MIVKNKKTTSALYKNKKEIIKKYKNKLVTYEAWKKLIEKGIPPLTLLKCKQADLVDYKVYGESVQEGENLFDGTFKNGYITGSAIKGFSETTVSHYLVVIPCKPNTTYIVKKSYATEKFTVCFTDEYPYTDCPITNYKNNNDAVEIENTSTENSQYLCAYVYNRTIDTLPVAEITVYEELSPDTPIEIESVGDKTKNLLEINRNFPYTQYGLTVSRKSDGAINVKGNVTTIASLYLSTGLNLTLPAGTYTIRNTGIKGIDVYLLPGYTRGTFTLNAPKTYTSVYIDVTSSIIGQSIDFDYYPQLEVGNAVTDYEPYGYKIPVKVSGKNLFNPNTPYTVSKAINKNGEIVGWGENWGVFDYVGVEPNTTYTRSYDSDTHMGTVIFYDENKNKIDYTVSFGVFTTPSNCKYVRFNIIIRTLPTFMLVLGEYTQEEFEQLAYESYVEPITTNIYLKEPLRKINDYTDYIDFEKGKVFRQVKEVVLDDTSDCGVSDTGSLETIRFSMNISDTNNYNPVLCDKLIPITSGISTKDIECVQISAKNIYMRLKRERLKTEDIAGIKEYLGTNNITFCYALEEEMPEKINLPNIPLNKGTTVIEVDTTIKPSNMEVTYLGKK